MDHAVHPIVARSIRAAFILGLLAQPLSLVHAESAGYAENHAPALSALSGTDLIFANGFDPAVVPCDPLQLLEDSSFEATDPNAFTNPFWPSSSTTFTSPFCTVAACGTGNNTAGPRTGTFWAWLGGTSGVETAHVEQSVVVPAGNPRHLNFWLRIGSLGGTGATMAVSVDGNIVRSFAEPAQADPDYVQYTVDMSAFTDDQSHLVAFTYTSTSEVSNFSLDDVTLECVASGQ